MKHAGDQVVASVEATFPKSGWARVLDLLESYGVESYERERKRVQLAILKLSAGSEEKVREYVAVAKRDYRDVLFWAEYPEESLGQGILLFRRTEVGAQLFVQCELEMTIFLVNLV